MPPSHESRYLDSMTVVFSDLDGTLLHLQTYTYGAAEPALEFMRKKRVPLVLSTSKTRKEIEFWREKLGNSDPFIAENGGAVFIPEGYFGFPVPGAVGRDGYEILESGTPYKELVDALAAASRQSGCRVIGFHDMTVAELAERTHLPPEQAELAKFREYDEPFEIVSTGTYNLLGAIEQSGKRWTRGDRFYHITGNNDKAEAVATVAALYRRAYPDVQTVGIGDGHNDAGFLNAVDIPVIIQSRFATALKRAVPNGSVTHAPGPHGWNEAVLGLFAEQRLPVAAQ